jgi:mannosyl-3-phosphoglycerate phosphatase
MKITKTAVFTDIDGTIIDENYSLKDTQSAIEKLLDLNVHIILCSSKTRLEIEYYRDKIGIKDPFISENGAAIFIPKGYFNSNHYHTRQTAQYDIVELGIAHSAIRKKLERIRKKSACNIIGFGDMSVEEIADDNGLPLELAALAKQREYSEPFIAKHYNEKVLFDLIEKEGLHCIKSGRYHHLTGRHDKGKAVSILKRCYIKEFGSLKSVGVGNGLNDLSMLNVVNSSFFVEKSQNLGNVWLRIIGDVLLLNGSIPEVQG